jgi:hypothetical protein
VKLGAPNEKANASNKNIDLSNDGTSCVDASFTACAGLFFVEAGKTRRLIWCCGHRRNARHERRRGFEQNLLARPPASI